MFDTIIYNTKIYILLIASCLVSFAFGACSHEHKSVSTQLKEHLPQVQSPYPGLAEMHCLATAIWHEARGEPSIGQAGVAHVILTRVKSPHYPNIICDVVYQRIQFSDVDDARPRYNTNEWLASIRIAELTFFGDIGDPTGGATHFYAHDKVLPWWAKFMRVTVILGGHTFLK